MSTSRPAADACPFCVRLVEGPPVVVDGTRHVAAFADGFPSAPGHTLIVPRRHVGRLADLTDDETADLWAVGMRRLAALASLHGPDGFTIGVNDGEAAGQAIAHVELHVIPRYAGDVPDPRGGVRWVLPGTAAYWNP